ncbi:hypothetical protein E5676_scaffold356G00100 [Cucumis melo var. makuwa]|uniref:Uncharacterized protein n=1 Tax=Cucumis melo var. makuwa TaxID=1194695 RepID=A0A5D3CKD8_CUCMM|nr:hypothetical protein E6C27_scaffold3921G00110 [Cucumis melo var. makuwa]TYK11995.1 hypothetical protein E5676_scaffold356G00100 [Cucumis melo var. makuwa]
MKKEEILEKETKKLQTRTSRRKKDKGTRGNCEESKELGTSQGGDHKLVSSGMGKGEQAVQRWYNHCRVKGGLLPPEERRQGMLKKWQKTVASQRYFPERSISVSDLAVFCLIFWQVESKSSLKKFWYLNRVLKVVPKNWHVPEHVQHVIPEEHNWSSTGGPVGLRSPEKVVIPKDTHAGCEAARVRRLAQACSSAKARTAHAGDWSRLGCRRGFEFGCPGRRCGSGSAVRVEGACGSSCREEAWVKFGCTRHTRSMASEQVGYVTMDDRSRFVDGVVAQRTTVLHGWVGLGDAAGLAMAADRKLGGTTMIHSRRRSGE